MRVKILSGDSYEALEKLINEWLSCNNFLEIKDIKFMDTSTDRDIYTSAMIIYKPRTYIGGAVGGGTGDKYGGGGQYRGGEGGDGNGTAR